MLFLAPNLKDQMVEDVQVIQMIHEGSLIIVSIVHSGLFVIGFW